MGCCCCKATPEEERPPPPPPPRPPPPPPPPPPRPITPPKTPTPEAVVEEKGRGDDYDRDMMKKYMPGLYHVDDGNFWKKVVWIPHNLKSTKEFCLANNVPLSGFENINEYKEYCDEKGWWNTGDESSLLEEIKKKNTTRAFNGLGPSFNVETEFTDAFRIFDGRMVRAIVISHRKQRVALKAFNLYKSGWPGDFLLDAIYDADPDRCFGEVQYEDERKNRETEEEEEEDEEEEDNKNGNNDNNIYNVKWIGDFLLEIIFESDPERNFREVMYENGNKNIEINQIKTVEIIENEKQKEENENGNGKNDNNAYKEHSKIIRKSEGVNFIYILLLLFCFQIFWNLLILN